MLNTKGSVVAAAFTCFLLYGVMSVCAEEHKPNDSQKSDGTKGLTVEELGRGLKSAAHNIEQEIPKLGAAIGNAVKKITKKEPDKSSSSGSPEQKK